MRLSVAIALVVGALVAAVVAVGAVASVSADRLPSGPASPLPTPTATAPAVRYEAASRSASVAELHLVLPGAPYSCDAAPRPGGPTFTSLVTCSALVHENYRGSADWTATTGLGVLNDPLVVPGDLKGTAEKVFGSLRTTFFRGTATTVRELSTQPFERAPADRSLVVIGEVRYRVRGVPSRYDRLVVLVVELAGGGYGVWFSSRPDDTPEATLAVLDEAIAGLSAR